MTREAQIHMRAASDEAVDGGSERGLKMIRPAGNKLEVTTPSDVEIVMTRQFDAPRQLVFEAHTKPEHMVRWFGLRGESMPVCEIDLRVGGKWRYVLSAPGGIQMGMNGEFQEIVPPERIVTTENFEGEFFEMMGSGTVNTMVLEEHDGKTTMTITVLYRSREARDAVLQTPMEQGAGEAFDRLEELLAELA